MGVGAGAGVAEVGVGLRIRRAGELFAPPGELGAGAGFGARAVEFEVLVEEEVANDAEVKRGELVENLLVGFKYIAEVLWQLERDGRYEDVTGTPSTSA